MQDEDIEIQSIPSTSRFNTTGIWRDASGRILIPQNYRKQLIDAVHNLSHTGSKSTLKQLQISYSWPGITKDVKDFVKNCTDCQSSKITKHIKPPYKNLGNHPKFSAIHIDFVGPLPINKNKRFLVTIFDRGSRWFSAYPVSCATAENAANALISWVSDHGVPEIIISDRGTHFEANLFREVCAKLGIEKRRVTAFHPSANGAVERQHRRLKEALKSKSENAARNWLKHLPMILLGLRNSISEDTKCSAAQIVYGRQLNIPNFIFNQEYDVFRNPMPNRNFERKDEFVPESLKNCKYVWLKKPGILPSLARPYSGPYKVLSRNFVNHTMTIESRGLEETVTMERIKPAWNLEHLNAETNSIFRHVTFS